MARNESGAKDEEKRQKATLQKLKLERNKLLQLFYAETIPLDVMADEQNRINREVQQADELLSASQQRFAEIQERLRIALEIIASCKEAYLAGSDLTRRRINQALFERILVDVDE